MNLTKQFKRVNDFLEKVPEDFLTLLDVSVNNEAQEIAVNFSVIDWENNDEEEDLEKLEKLEKLPMVEDVETLCELVTFYLVWD